MLENEPLLTMKLNGPEVEAGRVPIDHLVLLLKRVQVCVKRLAQELSGDASTVGAGRMKGPIEEACRLLVVAFKSGSFVVGIDVPSELSARESLVPSDAHLGKRAIETLVEGLANMSMNTPKLLNEFGYGVLIALRDVGKVLDRGVSQVEFELRNGAPTPRRAVLDYRVRDRILQTIDVPVVGELRVKGSLREVDLEKRSCKIFPPHGKFLDCSFGDHLEPAVRGALGYYVAVTGEARRLKSDGPIQELSLQTIEILGQPSKPTNAKDLLQSLRDAGLVGMWKDRDDMGDSSDFAAQLRTRVQEQQGE